MTDPFGSVATRLWRDESGSEIVEFALALAFLAVVAIAALVAIPTIATTQVNTNDNNFSQSLANGY
jgi:Flp pilus assembly pilin Flp